MKNKKFLVIIATALMACLVVGMGAMTYSKYITTTETGTKTATAAKWGFVVSADATNLFGEDYTGTDLSIVNNGATSGVTIASSADGKQIVAPGSTGSMSFSVSGKAEVKAQISITATSGVEELCADANYYPVKWTLTKTGEAEPLVKNGKLSDVITKINLGVATIPAGQSAESAGTYTITWAWALVTGATTEEQAINNVKDTVIGMTAEKGSALDFDTVKNMKVGEKTIGSVFTSQSALDAVKTQLTFSLTINVEQVQ